MKKISRVSILLFAAAAIVSSCHKAVPKQAQYIPKDAGFVISADAKSLQQKIAESGVNMDSLFKTFVDTAGSGSSVAGIKSWEDVKNSGIDFESNFFVFVNSGGSIMSGRSTSTGIVAAMKDQSAFEAFLKKQLTTVNIQKGSNYSYAVLKDGFAAGWNSDVVILSNVISYNYSENNGLSNNNSDDASVKQLATLFAQKEDESVASIPEFKDMLSQKADMLLWTNSTNTLSMIPFIGMTKIADLLKDSYSASTVNFEDGEVVLNSKSYSGKDLKDILSKYAGPKVDMDMVDKYPSAVNGFAAFSFDPQMIGAIAKYAGVDATANQFLQQMGFTLDDVLKAFKGDFAIMFSDFAVVEKPNEFDPSSTIKRPDAKLIVNAAIGDKASYDKIVAALAAKGEMVQQNGQYVFPEMGGFAMSVDDKNLIVASDDALLQQYKSGTAGKANIPSDVADKSKGNSVSFYVDVNSILKAIPEDSSAGDFQKQGNIILENAKATFKDVIASAKNFDGTSVNGSVELRTMNDKENSLATLVKFFSVVAQQVKTETQNMDQGMTTDSIPPMVDRTPMVDTTSH